MQKLQVISTTDGNNLGQIFEINDFSQESLINASGGRFEVERVILEGDIITLQNSNYTAVLLLLPNE